ncbi:MAG TPA: hypothetical protein VIV60_04425 [Polyangiaceae bacterium]
MTDQRITLTISEQTYEAARDVVDHQDARPALEKYLRLLDLALARDIVRSWEPQQQAAPADDPCPCEEGQEVYEVTLTAKRADKGK